MFWAVNGVGLSLVIPNGQSLIADYYEDLDRGKAFGALYLTGAVGAMLGTVFATNISALEIPTFRTVFLSRVANIDHVRYVELWVRRWLSE